nr:histidine kinase [Saprospiraceae bacterium]
LLETVLAAIWGVVVTYWFWMLSKRFDQWLPWQKNTGLRFGIGVLVTFLSVFAITYLAVLTYALFGRNVLLEGATSLWIKLAVLLFIITFVASVIYFAYHSYEYFTKIQIEEVRQERKQIDLQLQALKKKLTPHFLFNSLNTVSSLLYKDPKVAEVFIRRLATTYDYTLKNYNQQLVSLEEEINLVKAYHFLLSTRFDEQLDLTIQVPDHLLDSKIPPLTLQMLVENAAKHNTISVDQPLNVQVKAYGKWIEVENKRTASPKQVNSTKLGLKNIRERYELLAGESIQIEQDDFFRVKLPVIL